MISAGQKVNKLMQDFFYCFILMNAIIKLPQAFCVKTSDG